MNPDAFKYNFGFKDPVFYEFATSYLRIPGFNKMADVKAGKVFEIECGEDTDGEPMRVAGETDKKLALEFKKFAATHKFFAFLVKAHSSKCEPNIKRDRGVHLMTIFYNGFTESIEIYPEPILGFFQKRWEFRGDSAMYDPIKEILRKECGIKVKKHDYIEVPVDFIYQSKSASTSEAYMKWCLIFAKERYPHAKESFGMFTRWLSKNWSHVNLHMIYKAYEGYVDKWTKGKCSSAKVYNSETGTCVTKTTAKKYEALVTRPVKQIQKIMELSFDERARKKNPFPNRNEWMAYFRLKYPLLDSVMPNLDEMQLPQMMWAKNDEGVWELTVDEEIEPALDEFFEKEEKRFFAIWVLITNPPHWNHANLLIYDRFYNEFELWEPHGYEFGADHESLKDMYPAIKSWMHEKSREGLLPQDMELILPPDYCPVGDFFQRKEYEDVVRYDDTGMCATWSWWYIDTRLGNPTLNRKDAVKLAIKQLNALPDTRVYIRKYKQAIDNQIQEIVALGQDDFESALKEAEEKWKTFTETVCKEWQKNKNINPRTGKKISEKGKVWRQLHYTCP
jgi:hypothetical protein